MKGEYRINLNISREEARKFLFELASDDELRARIEGGRDSALEELGRRNIEVTPEILPDPVRLPPKKEIDHILYAADSLLDETASPFGLLVVFVFGAMPVTAGRTTDGDAAG
jgi:hypothetical protein